MAKARTRKAKGHKRDRPASRKTPRKPKVPEVAKIHKQIKKVSEMTQIEILQAAKRQREYKESRKAYKRKWREANPEKVREHYRNHQRKIDEIEKAAAAIARKAKRAS